MMKKICFLILASFCTLSVFPQAKKPILMVFPSDQYCISRGYSMTFDNQGLSQTLPDYKKALQTDPDLRLVITKMGQIMADRGFPLKDLEQEMKNIEQEGAEMAMLTSKSGAGIVESPIDRLKRTAKADIILDLDFTIKKSGPQMYISFNLKGLDAYSAKQVAGVAGAGKPSSAVAPEILLEEAVLSHVPYQTLLYLIQNNWQFAHHMLQIVCKELREAKVHPCETCVTQATELLGLHFDQIRSET